MHVACHDSRYATSTERAPPTHACQKAEQPVVVCAIPGGNADTASLTGCGQVSKIYQELVLESGSTSNISSDAFLRIGDKYSLFSYRASALRSRRCSSDGNHE